MVRFSRVWRAGLRMGHPQVRWSTPVMTQDGGMPAQFQGDHEDFEALPRNAMECEIFQARTQALLAAFKSAPSPRYLIADSKLYHEANAPHLRHLGFITRLPN